MTRGSVKIGGYNEDHLLKHARDVVEKKCRENTLFDKEAEGRIPKFVGSELVLGRVLGRGGFCVVKDVTKINLGGASRTSNGAAKKSVGSSGKQDEEDDQIANIIQDRTFMSKHYLRGGKDPRYAIKKLDDSTMNDPTVFVNGVVDLAIEARFLSVIRHPNVIKMRAICDGTPYSRDYFVVLDRLYDILSTRLGTWRKRKVKGFGKFVDRGGKKSQALWLERVTAAHDLACALKYLHSLNVMYRDLKPDNVGFDVRGDIKIFDFGLAKEFSPGRQDRDGCYKLTGDTGSPRYMAPEVALGKPYNESVDVYSFGILLWQMLALETPFETYKNMKTFQDRVVVAGVRPMPNPKWPAPLSDLVRKCWSVKMSERPTMEDIAHVLREEMSVYSDEDVLEILDVSRKSAMSLHGHYGN